MPPIKYGGYTSDSSSSMYGNTSYYKGSYTLDDLEEDEEFQSTAERFLESVGENSDDVFEYLRDSNFNLFSGMNRAIETGKFTDQQKLDYSYLRSKFDNADMGSFKQYLELIKDASIDIATDPTAIVAALTTPISGGTSLAARQGVVTAALKGANAVAKNKLKDVGKKQIYKATAITSAEVGAWTGLDNHFRQNSEINVGLRKMYSNPELVGSTAIGLLTGGIFGNLAQRHRLYNEDLNRLFTNDEYRKDAGSQLFYNIRKARDVALSNSFGTTARILRTFSEYSPTAKQLGQTINEEFSKRIGERSTKTLGWSYFENLGQRRGDYMFAFDAAVAPIRKTGQVLKEDEIAVIRILRGGSTLNASKQVKQTARSLRNFYDDIYKDAYKSGLISKKQYEIFLKDQAEGLINYFPRSWNRKAIQDDIPEFRKMLLAENIEDVTEKNVDDIIEGMLNKQNELFASHSNLLTQARVFRGLNDNKFEKFLTNDLVPVTTNYYMNAAKSIQHKIDFLAQGSTMRIAGKTQKESLILFKQSNEEQFIQRFINPINEELIKVRGRGLTRKDKKRITNAYKSVTGQVDYFDNGLIQGIYDTTKLANAMAYLPLATVSSLTEAFIPLTKAPIRSSVQGMQDSITKGHKIFTHEIYSILKEKHNMKRSDIMEEMNRLFIAVDEAMGDVTNRISGEGLQNEFLKAQARRFYRFNLLVPWTKTVQLASFSTGKDLIRQNLTKLNAIKKEGVDIFSETAPIKVQNLKGELFDLGINIEDGIKWLDAGAKQTDAFYNEQLVRGAGRYTNSVSLPTARESARVPRFMTNPKVDILTQFLRYPTVFGNTILKNFARDTINNPATNAPKVVAFVAMATNVALATNYWRSPEQIQDTIDRRGVSWRDTVKAYQRVGLLGPLEYGLRFSEAVSYGQNPALAFSNLGGPVMGDVIGMAFYDRGLLETMARKTPLVGTKNVLKRYTGLDPYTPIKEAAKKQDKKRKLILRNAADLFAGREEEGSGFSNPFKNTGFKSGFSKGGRVSYAQGLGVSKDVPNVKDEPENKINPYTGEPYSASSSVTSDALRREKMQDELSRLGFKIGGQSKSSIILQAIQRARGFSDEEMEKLKEYSTSVGYTESDNIADRAQESGGPGRGKYQYELSTEKGSGANKTALQRYENFLTKHKLEMNARDLEIINSKNLDFSTLSEDEQDAIFYADQAMGNLPLADLVSGKLSFDDAWYTYHYAGKDETKRGLLGSRASQMTEEDWEKYRKTTETSSVPKMPPPPQQP